MSIAREDAQYKAFFYTDKDDMWFTSPILNSKGMNEIMDKLGAGEGWFYNVIFQDRQQEYTSWMLKISDITAARFLTVKTGKDDL